MVIPVADIGTQRNNWKANDRFEPNATNLTLPQSKQRFVGLAPILIPILIEFATLNSSNAKIDLRWLTVLSQM